ncbi:MAG: iron ABC transporter permease [Deltaproteobacteria bacterium]|nr:iron ABC transporter permease [Deltaproteobacteria bacterium]
MALAAALGARAVDLRVALDPSVSPNPDRVLLLEVRLPRVVLGALAGGALASVGVALQALLRNPLGDPYVLGTSGGAALGATLALVVGVPVGALGGLVLPLWAFAGAVLATLVAYAAAHVTGRATTTSVLLAGVVINAFTSAAIMLIKTLVTSTKAQEMLFWLMGFIGNESWPTLGMLAVYVLVGTVALSLLGGRMNLLSLGDSTASHLGLDVKRTKQLLLGVSSLVVGGVVALCGLIGFVGLVVPHALRLSVGPDHRVLVPASALAGATFVVLADLAARLSFDVFGTEPPVGAITAVIGCPVFLWLMARYRHHLA